MKRINTLMFFIAALLVPFIPAQAVASNSNETNTDSLYVEDITVKPGTQFEIPVMFSNTNKYTAFQCDITVSEGLTLVMDEEEEYEIYLSNSRMTNSHSMAIATTGERSIRLVCYSSSSKNMKGNEGALFFINASTEEGFEGRLEIEINNIRFSTSDGREVVLSDTKGVITVASAVNEVIMQDNSVTDSNTVQLPVELKNESQITSLEADLLLPEGLSLEGIALAEERCDVSFTGSISLLEDNIVHISLASENNTAFAGSEGVIFYLYLGITLSESDTKEVALTNISAADVDGKALSIKDAACSVEIIFDSYTGIASVESKENAVVNAYNLQGVVVKRGVAVEKELPAGTYILNGKKVYIK